MVDEIKPEAGEAPGAEAPDWYAEMQAQSNVVANAFGQQLKNNPLAKQYEPIILFLGMAKCAAQLYGFHIVTDIKRATGKSPDLRMIQNANTTFMDSIRANFQSGLEFGEHHAEHDSGVDLILPGEKKVDTKTKLDMSEVRRG